MWCNPPRKNPGLVTGKKQDSTISQHTVQEEMSVGTPIKLLRILRPPIHHIMYLKKIPEPFQIVQDLLLINRSQPDTTASS